MNKITTLTHQQEIKLLTLAKKGKTKKTRERAIRLLIYHNQPFIKFLVRGFYYPQNEISPESLVTEGEIAFIKAIENFDLAKAEQYRLGSYSGFWVNQKYRSLIKTHQMFPMSLQKRYFKGFKGDDYYEILGLEKNATEDEIKKRFIELKEKYENEIFTNLKKKIEEKTVEELKEKFNREPTSKEINAEIQVRLNLTDKSFRDKEWNKANDELQKIQEAYETLSDPQKREDYDNLRKERKNLFSKKEIHYYDKKYDREKDDKAVSLIDTLVDEEDESEKQIEQEWLKLKINDLLEHLEYQDNLLIRLYFGIVPVNLMQLYPLITSKRKKELENLFNKNKQEMKNIFLANQENIPIINKYIEILSVPRKKEGELIELIKRKDFWQDFANFADLAKKISSNKTNRKIKKDQLKIDKKEWNNISEKEIRLWINLGYQPEDIIDPMNYVLKNMNISKAMKEQWEKSTTKSGKIKESNLIIKLEKWIELRRKSALAKLKKLKEDLDSLSV